jgi:DNA-binding PadR family transcriptional regulator
MRRKPGNLTPLELSILEAAATLRRNGHAEFYGFLIAKEIKRQQGARFRTAYGTLYKALERMEQIGMLTSAWEDADIAQTEGRPRRRLYQVTTAGEEARKSTISAASTPRLATSEGAS